MVRRTHTQTHTRFWFSGGGGVFDVREWALPGDCTAVCSTTKRVRPSPKTLDDDDDKHDSGVFAEHSVSPHAFRPDFATAV